MKSKLKKNHVWVAVIFIDGIFIEKVILSGNPLWSAAIYIKANAKDGKCRVAEKVQMRMPKGRKLIWDFTSPTDKAPKLGSLEYFV